MPFLLSPGNTSSRTSRPPTHHYIFLTSFLFWSTAKWAQLFYCNGRGEFCAPTCFLLIAFHIAFLLIKRPFKSVRFHFTAGIMSPSLNKNNKILFYFTIKDIARESPCAKRFCIAAINSTSRKKTLSVGACEGEQLLSLAVLCRISAPGNAPWCQMDARDLWREEEEEELVQDARQTRGISCGIVSAWERRAQRPGSE